MENITLGQISIAIAFIVTFIGGVKYILNDMNKVVEKALKPTNGKIDGLEKTLKDEISKSDMNATKNFLVARISDLKAGVKLDDITLERFWEQYEHYINLGGNSYIKNEVEKLKKEGVL